MAGVPLWETLDPTWLAASPVVGVLHKHLGEAAVRVDEVSLRFVLEHLIADRRVNVAIAAKLGAYLTEQFFDLEQGYLWSHEEMNNVQHYLKFAAVSERTGAVGGVGTALECWSIGLRAASCRICAGQSLSVGRVLPSANTIFFCALPRRSSGHL